MRGERKRMLGSVAGAALDVLLAPRYGGTRRAALRRLRVSLSSGRGSVDAFAGTPCSTGGPTSVQAEASPAGRDQGGPAA